MITFHTLKSSVINLDLDGAYDRRFFHSSAYNLHL